mgnify:CR=1 FL=1
MNSDTISNLISKESSSFVFEVSSEAIQLVISHNNADFENRDERLKETIRLIKVMTDLENQTKEQKLITHYYINSVTVLVK